MAKKPHYCYLNGKIMPLEKATVNVNDIGLLRGYGVFDFARTVKGKPFMFNHHIERFKNSAQMLDLKIPLTDKDLQAVVEKLIKKNGFKESTIRMVLTGGQTLGNGLEYNKNKPTFFIIVAPFVPLPETHYTEGVSVMTVEHQRSLPAAKTNNYIVAVQNQNIRKRLGAFEILYFDKDKFLEMTTSNFFIVKKGVIVCPKDNILLGTTRNAVLKLAGAKFSVEEREITVQDLRKADEAFLTATNKGIVPIVKIDDRAVGNGKVGPVTQALIKAYLEYMN